MKFGPGHFPLGTVFTLKSTFHSEAPKELTVQRVIRNGVRSYVLDTGLRNPRIQGITWAFNIEHVASIVRRGSGPLAVDHSSYGTPGSRQPHMQRDHELLCMSAPENLAQMGTRRRRNFVITGSLSTLLMYYAQRIVPKGMALSYSSLATAVCAQSWCTRRESKHFGAFEVNVRRLKRYISQNWTRHLTPLDQLQALQDEQNEAYYQQMWED